MSDKLVPEESDLGTDPDLSNINQTDDPDKPDTSLPYEDEEGEEEEKEQTNEDAGFDLLLGDIIKLHAPQNEVTHMQTYYIKYIDEFKIVMVNIDSRDTEILHIEEGGVIGDPTIVEIELLYRQKETGFARQNGLVKGVWVNLRFGGDVPAIVTAEITNLEGDTIEITVYPDSKVYYIPFDYKGIPENMYLEKIEIRSAPEDISSKLAAPEPAEPLAGEKSLENLNEETGDAFSDQEEYDESHLPAFSQRALPIAASLQDLRKNIVAADRIVIGDVLEEVEEFVEVSGKFKRYNIGVQKDDMLESMLSTIPTKNRTATVLKEINAQIERFVQLRNEYSEMDKNGVVTTSIIRSHLHKPLKEHLLTGEAPPQWVIFGALSEKKVGDGFDALTEIEETIQAVANGAGDQNKYVETYEQINANMTPFDEPVDSDKCVIIHLDAKNEIPVIANNDGDYHSNAIAFDEYASTRFLITKYNTGLTHLEHGPVNKMSLASNVVNMTPADRIPVVSLLTLPTPFILHSKVDLPGTDMVTRANLHATSLNFWQLLKKHTHVRTKQVTTTLSKEEQEEKEREHERMERQRKKEIKDEIVLAKSEGRRPKEFSPGIYDSYFDKINHFVPKKDDGVLVTAEGGYLPMQQKRDRYEQFLDNVVPTTKEIFNIMSKYIRKVSLTGVVEALEPFLIYTKHLTYTQYKNIVKFVDCRITKYNKAFKFNQNAFNKIKRLQRKYETFAQSKTIYGMRGAIDMGTVKHTVFSSYDGTSFNTVSSSALSNSELLKKMLTDDYGRIYNLGVSVANLKLSYPGDLAPLFSAGKEEFKKMIEQGRSGNMCNNYVLAKKYRTKVELTEDNGVEIYYDKIFDKTPYDILDDYQKEQRRLPPDQFLSFLGEKLRKKYKYKTQSDDLLNDIKQIVQGTYKQGIKPIHTQILEKYELQQQSMSVDNFIHFLRNEMQQEEDKGLAQTIVDGVKKVNDGDYAVFYNTVTSKFEYYVRKSNQWELDEKASSDLFIADPNILCNLQTDCLYAENQINGLCESIDATKDVSKDTLMKSIVDQFDNKYELSKKDREKELGDKLQYYVDKNEKNQVIKRNFHRKSNNYQYELGVSLSEEPDSVESPYKKLMEIILSQSDIVERNSNVIRFCELCTRQSYADKENPHWLYCAKTGVKLMPTFIKTLAQTFITNNEDYDTVLQLIKKDIGVLSDDGDKIVDQYSGFEIDQIRFSTDEGHDDDGFAISSRDVIAKDWGGDLSTTATSAAGVVDLVEDPEEKTATALQRKEILTPMTAEMKNIYIIVNAMSSAIGVHIPKQMEFIARNVKTMLSELLYSEEEHDLKNEALLKKGKPVVSYEDHKNGIILYLTLGMFIIAVQTNIPTVKTRKTYPGCVSTLKGFPLGESGDLDFVNYIACVVYKTRIAHGPWKVLMKKKEDYIATAIFSYIEQYLLKLPEVSSRIKDKYVHIHEIVSSKNEADVEELYGAAHFESFLPPLKSFTIKHLNGVTTEFEEMLLSNLKIGSGKQQEQILVLQSKIIAFSLAMQEEIQTVLDAVITKSLKKTNSYDLLISYGTQFAVENACCNDDMKNNAVAYFADKSDKLRTFHDIVKSYSQILADIRFQSTARQFFSTVNTKNVYPQIGVQFNKSTIYKAFIYYCNLSNKKFIPERLRKVCPEKPVALKKNDTIDEQIKKIENSGVVFTNESMSELLSIVCKENVASKDLPIPPPSKMTVLRNIVSQVTDDSVESQTRINEIVPLSCRPLFEALGHLLKENHRGHAKKRAPEALRDLRNYLLNESKNMKKIIVTFLTKHGRLSKDRVAELTSFLNTVTSWNDNASRNRVSASDGDMNNAFNFVKMYMHHFVNVFPNVILAKKINKFDKKTVLPKHWGVSPQDAETINADLSNYYSPLGAFFGDNNLEPLLANIDKQLKIVVSMANATPASSLISNDEEDATSSIMETFDKETSYYLFEYYFLTVLNQHIELTNEMTKSRARTSLTQGQGLGLGGNMYSAASNGSILNVEDEVDREFAGLFSEGAKKMVRESVASLLISYLDIMLTHKLTVNVSYDFIMQNVFKIQRAEARTFTERLEKLQDDEREADTALRTLKLGKWNKGLQKSLTVYDKNDADEETMANNLRYQEIEKMGYGKARLGADEDAVDEMAADENELNELGMGAMGEDYDDGDPYGDEYEEQ
jgi:hypothetical protein